jgi:hypothetical protein
VRALRRRRSAAQLLGADGAPGPEAAVRRLLAVQAQDLRAARLALRARIARPAQATARDVDRLLDDGQLVVGWLLRGTLHLVDRDDYGWLLGLTAPTQATTTRRRLAEEGVAPDDADRAVQLVRRALAADGPLTRAQLGERLRSAGIPTAGQALPHLLGLAAQRGVVLRGPVREEGQAFVLARDALGANPPTSLQGDARSAALKELARRYLAGHGPATPGDLAAWSGLPLRDARAGIAALGTGVTGAGAGGLIALQPVGPAPPAPPPRLLPAFDPYLLGWKDRSFAVAVADRQAVHPGGGIVRPTAIVDGHVAATWRRDDAGGIKVDPLMLIPRRDRRSLDREAEDIARFEG